MIRVAIITAMLTLAGCQSEEGTTAEALSAAHGALLPFATAAGYITPDAPDGSLTACMPVSINGQYVTDYCLTAGELRAAADAIELIEGAE